MFKLVTTQEVKKAYLNERKYKIDFDFSLPVTVENKLIRRLDRPDEFVQISTDYYLSRTGSTAKYVRGKPAIRDRMLFTIDGPKDVINTHFYRAFVGDIPNGFRLANGVYRNFRNGTNVLPELMYLLSLDDLNPDAVDDSKAIIGTKGLILDKDDTGPVILELFDGAKAYITKDGKIWTDRSKDSKRTKAIIRGGSSNLVTVTDGYRSMNLTNLLYKAFVDPSINLYTNLVIPKNGYPNDVRIDNLMSLGDTRKVATSYGTYVSEIMRTKPGYSIKAKQVSQNQYAISYVKADYPILEISNLNGDYLIGGLDDCSASYTAMCQLREACSICGNLRYERRHQMLQHLHSYLGL